MGLDNTAECYLYCYYNQWNCIDGNNKSKLDLLQTSPKWKKGIEGVWRSLKSTKKYWWDVPSGWQMECYRHTGVMVSINARETEEVSSSVQTGNVSPFLFLLHLPMLSLSCSVWLYCFFQHTKEKWRTWLRSLTLSSDEKFSFLRKTATGDSMKTQCHTWSKAFPEQLLKDHSQLSMMFEQLSRLRGGEKETDVLNILLSCKRSLLLMLRSVNNWKASTWTFQKLGTFKMPRKVNPFVYSLRK